MPDKTTTADLKRLWLQGVRASKGMSVTEFADALHWNRSDASAMLNGTGGRGIPDDRIDEVIKTLKVPGPFALTSERQQAPSIDIDRLMVANANIQAELRELSTTCKMLAEILMNRERTSA